MFDPNGLGLREVFIPLGHVHAIEPNALRGPRIIEEQNVSSDARVRSENTLWKAQDSMQVHVLKQATLDLRLCTILAKEKTIRNDNSSAAASLKTIKNESKE